jgi:alpha-1,6-mannosyltransferase
MPTQVPDNVSVVGHFCPASEIARMLASADALLHAGDQETFGLVILEAMASGIPVVAVAAGAFNEIIPQDCGLLCDPNSAPAMADAVLRTKDSRQDVMSKIAIHGTAW